MSHLGTKLGAAAALVTVALSFAAAPAQAHGWGGYGSQGHHHHSHGYRYGGYAPRCFVVYKQFFDGYNYVSRPVTVCN